MHTNFIELNHPTFSATVSIQGAQLIAWQPKHTPSSVLWATELDSFKTAHPFRGGIPICWPWFGKSHSPAHGFARILPWNLIHQIDTDEHIILTFKLRDSKTTRDIWPHPFVLTLTMILGLTCTLTLNIQSDCATTGAFHTYLYTDEITCAQITGLGNHYLDMLNEACPSTAPHILSIKHQVDQIYTDASTYSELIEPHRTINLHHFNASDIVLWNPWDQSPSDMNHEAYRHMICIESARIHYPFLEQDTLKLTIKVSDNSRYPSPL